MIAREEFKFLLNSRNTHTHIQTTIKVVEWAAKHVFRMDSGANMLLLTDVLANIHAYFISIKFIDLSGYIRYIGRLCAACLYLSTILSAQ